MVNGYDDMVKNIVSRSVPSLTRKLKEMAEEAGWPEDAIEAVSVQDVKGDFKVTIEPAQKELVEGLEYGNSKHTPTAVIRRFSAQVPKLIEEAIAAEFKNSVDTIMESL